MKKMVIVNMTGGPEESSKLNFPGDSAIRALMLANDSLVHNKRVDILVCLGMSNHQMASVDLSLLSRGYIKLVHPDFIKEKEKDSFTCVTAAYIRRELNPEQVFYEDKAICRYRYVAFRLPEEIEVRAVHIPAAEEAQNARKESMLLWEECLEKEENIRNAKVIVCGDFNTETGNLTCHEIFDRLPYDKLLNEPTWRDRKLDNVLISPALRGKVTAYTKDYRLGITSDHKTVVVEIN